MLALDIVVGWVDGGEGKPSDNTSRGFGPTVWQPNSASEAKRMDRFIGGTIFGSWATKWTTRFRYRQGVSPDPSIIYLKLQV
jgi:hypothetical protein